MTNSIEEIIDMFEEVEDTELYSVEIKINFL